MTGTDMGDERLITRLVESMDKPQSARVWDALDWGKDNYEVDRILAERVRAQFPGASTAVRAARVFHRGAVETLARDGVRQFLDIGAGLGPSVHLVAQREIPDADIVYVDNDPLVLCHGRAMSANDTVHWFGGGLEHPQAILDFASKRLDFNEPTAVSLVGVIELVPGQSHALRWVRALLAPLAAGSALVLSTATADHAPEQIEEAARTYTNDGILYRPRTHDQVAAFFERLVLDEPGIITSPLGKATDAEVSTYVAIGRKP
ncbi:SAM-dependent methyltransferase [Nocardia nova]|uniref:SAM-dependent methyltransferase n=1 Tax=Nocardia nova TaxID=37330 RepID=UPI001C4469BD|nr:SAM-dependent methyltransferase [Nocardia nova]MBV7708099.1 SAM-dependent methyltransferase [Nocardia nova]